MRGVRQGCPFAPYLFPLIGEALNMAAKEEQRQALTHGILLPGDEQQRLLSQYADDTSFSPIGEELNVQNTITLMHNF